MKKYILMAAVASMAFASCEDMLDTENWTGATTDNYPAKASDLDLLLTGAYSCLNQYGGGDNQGVGFPFFIFNLMSDECFGGGGTSDLKPQATSQLLINDEATFQRTWESVYCGIARANTIIASVDNFDWTGNEARRNQLLGEAFFLRGFYTLDGTQLWGDIPAYWEKSCPLDQAQVPAEEIYPHILADFCSAASLINEAVPGSGHATSVAAKGYLARAYMFFEGFYKKNLDLAAATPEAVALPAQEGAPESLTKADVIKKLEEVMAAEGTNLGLVEDYRLLWQYTNELTIGDYAFCSDLANAGKTWAGNGNKEQLFQIQFSNCASWNGTIGMGFTNYLGLNCGLRTGKDAGSVQNGDASTTFPFGQGWGWGVMNKDLYEAWDSADPRKAASIADCANEFAHFAWVSDVCEETGFYSKKIMSCITSSSSIDASGAGYTWWGQYMATLGKDYTCTNGNSLQGDHFNDIILMRYADVLLMHSELSGSADGMNKVRARAGLPAISYSLDAIKRERQHEFTFEGLRFNDLRRWSGKGAGKDCYAAQALQKQEGSFVFQEGANTTMKHQTCSWAERYAATDGFLPIPAKEIRVTADENLLKQNPGWGEGDKCELVAKPKY